MTTIETAQEASTTMSNTPTTTSTDEPATEVDEVTETESEEKPADESPEEPTEEPQGDDEPDDEDDDEGETGLDLKGAQSALAKVRRSEAKMRTRLRDIEAKLEGSLTQEQVDEIRNELSTANATEARTLLVENVALKHSLPAELADALKGDTREELEAHASTLARFAPSRPSHDPELEGGLNPGSDEGPFDAQAALNAARAARTRRY